MSVYVYMTDTHKSCSKCKLILLHTCFNFETKGKGGLTSACITCRKLYYTKQRSREQSTRWRANNREVFLSRNRLAQFKRTTLKDVVDDGTVTISFIKSIYGEEFCYYCNSEIDLENRTLDHKIPLIVGGAHSANNIVMACKTCNSSKGRKTENQFLAEIINVR